MTVFVGFTWMRRDGQLVDHLYTPLKRILLLQTEEEHRHTDVEEPAPELVNQSRLILTFCSAPCLLAPLLLLIPMSLTPNC